MLCGSFLYFEVEISKRTIANADDMWENKSIV